MSSVRGRLQSVLERVGAASKGRPVTLIAATKGVSAEMIMEAYEAGHRDFGESKLQEALPKIEALPKDIQWHFIGHLQSNKAKRAASAFRVIHSLDSPSQIAEIAKTHYAVDGLLEVNIADEPQKTGVSPKSLDNLLQTVLECSNVRLRGLMTVGPAHPNAEQMRPYFSRLRELAKSLGPNAWLSMGMSGDFEVAIQEGATHVRVGTAIFGSRS